MRRFHVRPLLPASLLLLAFAVSSGSSAAQTGTGLSNRTDAAFAALMLPHHEGGVKLGQMAAQKGVNAEIRQLGRQIVKAQTSEAKTLRRMVRQFKTTAAMAPEIERRDELDMLMLRSATGMEFDRMWLMVISGHHMSAIQMAQMETRGGRNTAARLLARRIVIEQRRELADFNTLTQKLG
jgi:uncharacterized protein (DUF305 family)